jgi:xylan 1,4-beta-xylosidase
MGSPVAPNEHLYSELRETSQLAALTTAPTVVNANEGTASIAFRLPRQGVSLLRFEW